MVSKCGAADVLEALGVKIDISPKQSADLLKQIDICFLFAQNYHIAMKYVAPVRKELGIRTVFNILGPLTNPAGASMQIMGVYDETLVEPLARVLNNLGVKRAMAVLMNAGAAIYIGGKAQDLQEGIAIARQMIDEGKALKKLEDFIQASQVEV